MSSLAWSILILPSAVVLWWIYRRGDTSRERILGSTLLLERAQIVSRSVRWQPPWRALIEALILLGVILALTDPFEVIKARTPIAVVAIDTSPRMLVRVADKEGTTRLDRARVRAIELVQEFEPGTRVIVISQHGTIGPLSASEAVVALEKISVRYDERSVFELLSDARGRFPESLVHVVGEGTVALPTPTWLRWYSVDEQAHDNVAIVGVDTGRREVVVRSYSLRPETLALVLSDISGKPQGRLDLTIPAGEQRSVRFSGSFPNAGAVLLSRPGGADALALDDLAYFVEPRQDEGIVVSSALSLQALGLTETMLPGFRFVASDASALGTRQPRQLLHRQPLLSEQEERCADRESRRIVSITPSGSGLRSVEDARITWWNEQEDLLRYVTLDLLRLPQVMVLPESTSTGAALALTNTGPVITRSNLGDCSEVRVGFELLPFSRGGDKSVSILTLNLLSWLSEEASSASAVTVIPSGVAWKVGSGSDSETTRIASVLGELRAEYAVGQEVSAPGLYRVERKGVSSEFRARTFRSETISDNRIVAVHSIGVAAEREVRKDESESEAESVSSDTNQPLRWLLAAIGVLLLVDILYVLARGGHLTLGKHKTKRTEVST